MEERLSLRLRPAKKPKKGVQWREGTVDNEDQGKRKSKKCCIFHKQRQFGEWSDADDSDQEGGDPCCGHRHPEGQQGHGSEGPHQNQPPQQQPVPQQ